MRLKPEQLNTHVNKPLQPIYLLSGDEPLQLMESLDTIRAAARTQGYTERVVLEVDKSFDWHRLNDESASLSLFASQKIIELKLGSFKPGREGGAALQDYAADLPEGNLLMISCAKLDKSAQSTKWFKALEKAGVIIQVWPIEAAQLPGWIQQRMAAMGKRIDREAAEFITARVEGNLMAANQELNKLCLLVDENEIHMEDVLYAVVDNARYDVFSLMESAYLGDLSRSWRMLEGLKNEGLDPMAIYGALIWEYRRLCSMAYDFNNGHHLEQLFNSYRIWAPARKQATQKVLRRHKLNTLHQLLKKLIKIEYMIKSAERVNAWTALLEFISELAGPTQNHYA